MQVVSISTEVVSIPGSEAASAVGRVAALGDACRLRRGELASHGAVAALAQVGPRRREEHDAGPCVRLRRLSRLTDTRALP